MVRLFEDYVDFIPPSWVEASIGRLLSTLPTGFCNGLSAIVLTNTRAAVRGQRRRRRERHRSRDLLPGRGLTTVTTDLLEHRTLGYYQPLYEGRPGRITLFVDNILRPLRRQRLVFAVSHDLLLAPTLYHEIGHHLEHTIGTRKRNNEEAADDWARRLTKRHLRERFPVQRHVWCFTPRCMAIAICRFRLNVERVWDELDLWWSGGGS